MSRLIALLALCAALVGTAVPASSQSLLILPSGCGTGAYVNGVPYLTLDTTGRLCGNTSVSVGGFTPSATGAQGTPINVTTSDSSGTLPTGVTTIVSNVGTTNPMYCNVNGNAATTSDQLITANGGWFSFTRPTGVTTLHCIATGGSTTANMVGGSGIATGTGGGSGGGGGGSAGAGSYVNLDLKSPTLTAWTSATAANATQTLFSAGGPPAVLVQLNQTSTIAAGAVTFEGTFDGTNWVTIPPSQVINANTFAVLSNPYTLVASTNQPFLILTQGYQSVRIKLSTQITGTATVTPFVALLNYNPTIGALLNPLVAGSATIGTTGSLPYPIGATPLTASTTGTTAATTATLAGTSGKTTYICSYSIRGNATANANVTNTITGVVTGTLSRAFWVPANTAGLGVDEMIYSPCLPASATNTGISAVSGALGTGGVVTVNATGYQL